MNNSQKIKAKKKKKLLVILILVAAIAIGLLITYAVQKIGNKLSREISAQEAEAIIEKTLDNLPNKVATGANYVADNTEITVTDISYGTDKNALVTCTYSAPAVGSVVSEHIGDYLSDAYGLYTENAEKGIKTNATKIKLRLASDIEADLSEMPHETGSVVVEILETTPGNFEMYLSDETVNTLLGGILDAQRIINESETLVYQGETINIANHNTLRSGVRDCIALTNYSSAKPDTSVGLERAWNSFRAEFYRNFIEKNRWTYIVNGLGTTIAITLCSVLLGIIIGFIVAVIRCVNQKTGKLDILSDICKIYLAVIRGTPVMVQLLIIYFVILLPLGVEKFISAVLCFGFNSGAYVSEIIRGGIMAVDDGQTEAGRSLGFTYMQTMFYIIIPQAFKAVLPALANEFIALLKESSIAFYIGVTDLTLGGLKIRSVTYSNFMPLIAIAIVYLIVVLGLSKCVSLLERRLRKGDKR